jgi:hypothetical protein
MRIHHLRSGKTQMHASGQNIAVDTSEHLPSAKAASADHIPEILKLENMKIRKVAPEMGKVKIQKKYINF